MEYASKSVTGIAGAGLGTGIAGLTLGLLNGGLGNLLGGGMNNCGCSDNMMVNRYELNMQQELAAKDAKIGLLESNIYTDQKLADVYERLNAKIEDRIGGVNCRIDGAYAQLNQQAVMNATITANLGCMAQQIAQLHGLTKLVVPNTSVCPGWGNVTITPAAATTGA